MIYTTKIQEAIKLAIETHEINQKQKRKGNNNIPYIIHPLTVGLILASSGATENTIVAGILHDTIEDSIKNKKITKDIIFKKFGKEVADLVVSVTEKDKSLSWEKRKQDAFEHIKNFSKDSVLLKSADLISNVSEIKDNYDKNGDKVFEKFKGKKEKTLEINSNAIKELIKKWPKNPLNSDLNFALRKIKNITN